MHGGVSRIKCTFLSHDHTHRRGCSGTASTGLESVPPFCRRGPGRKQWSDELLRPQIPACSPTASPPPPTGTPHPEQTKARRGPGGGAEPGASGHLSLLHTQPWSSGCNFLSLLSLLPLLLPQQVRGCGYGPRTGSRKGKGPVETPRRRQWLRQSSGPLPRLCACFSVGVGVQCWSPRGSGLGDNGQVPRHQRRGSKYTV